MSIEQKVLEIIWNSLGKKRATFGHGFDSAYHSISINGKLFRGQREVTKRIELIPFDFNNKIVLDIGCNIGGMLHELKNIKYGIGIDYNSKCINAANLLCAANNVSNLNFYTFDLQNEPINLIDNFLLDFKVDICFLLSMALWVNNWKEIIKYCYRISPYLVYESNGNKDFQQEQEGFLNNIYKKVNMISENSLDDNRDGHGSKLRKMFFCAKE